MSVAYLYEVLDSDQICMMTTDFFYEAVKYARQNGWVVYSAARRMVVYDGSSDELMV